MCLCRGTGHLRKVNVVSARYICSGLLLAAARYCCVRVVAAVAGRLFSLRETIRARIQVLVCVCGAPSVAAACLLRTDAVVQLEHDFLEVYEEERAVFTLLADVVRHEVPVVETCK